jgi:regulator of RNase E activity RraB
MRMNDYRRSARKFATETRRLRERAENTEIARALCRGRPDTGGTRRQRLENRGQSCDITRVPQDWNFYFCNVNGKLASVALDLGLRELVPDSARLHLLWVWVYLRCPRHDGLSDSSEFRELVTIEEALTASLAGRFDAVLSGRITTDGRREFYYYGAHSEGFDETVSATMERFPGYTYDSQHQVDKDWRQYLNVLYPREEDRQKIENRKVLDALQNRGDALKRPRDISHWAYFRTAEDRANFRNAVRKLEYRVQSESELGGRDYPLGICIVRFQSIQPAEVDDAVIELYRLAKECHGDYDGWEAEVISDDARHR